MRLEFSNIGKIAKADITIEGITVVCGENNVGKSTIGKVLYAMYDGFKDASSVISANRKKLLKDVFEKLHEDFLLICNNFISERSKKLSELHPEIYSMYVSEIKAETNVNENVNQIISNHLNTPIKPQLSNKYVNDLLKGRDVSEVLDKYCSDTLEILFLTPSYNGDENVLKWKKRASIEISKWYSIPDDEILGSNVKESFNAYFFNQYLKSQNPTQPAEIKLSNSKGELKVNFNILGNCMKAYRSFNVASDDLPIFIDDPRILDSINESCFSRELLRPNSNLKPKKSNKKSTDTTDSIRIAMVNQKIQDEISQLEQLMNGKFIIQNGTVKFKDNNVSDALSVENLSLGMKSMGVLERCLSSGFVQEGSIIILDEPEIHLHPEWQMKYAEYIVLLQKALDLRVLITTHSPQFLRAIECYTDKYNTMDKLNVYAFEGESIKNCSYSEYGVSEIYEKMTAPYDELQDMIDEKYGECDE